MWDRKSLQSSDLIGSGCWKEEGPRRQGWEQEGQWGG
jgi:hypothetical protein